MSQNGSTISHILKSKTSDDEKIRVVDSIATFYGKSNRYMAMDSLYTEYGSWLYKKKKYKNTVKILSASLSNQDNLSVLDTLLWQKRLYYLGLSYRKIKEYHKSISIFQNPIIEYRKNEKTAKSYSELGRCYKAINDYYKAIKYYKLGASLLSKQGNDKSLLINYINTSQAFLRLKTSKGYENAIDCFLKADSLANTSSAFNDYTYFTKMGLGKAFNQTENLDIKKASSYYKEALDIALKTKDSSRVFDVYIELGNLYSTTNPNRGIKYLQQANLYIKNTDLSFPYNDTNLAHCYLIKGAYNKSIAVYLKAISYIIKTDYKNLQPDQGQSTSILHAVENKTPLLRALINLSKAYYLKYSDTGDKKILNKVIEIFTVADELLDIILIESTELESKLFWRRQSSELYGRAIKVCFQVNNKDKAFYFMEKSKALLLTKTLKNLQLKQNKAIPKAIIKREITLKKDIYILGKQQKIEKNQDSVSVLLLKRKKELLNLQDSIKKVFTEYKVIKTSDLITTIKVVQKSLGQDDMIVTYHISRYDDYGPITENNGYQSVVENSTYGFTTKNSSYAIAITNEEIYFFELGHPDHLKRQVLALSKKMATPYKSDKDNYMILANQVFNNLFPTEELRALIKNKKLLVVPDDYLNTISFEALVTNFNNKFRYLIEDSELSYTYSNSFSKAVSSHNYASENSFLGFAPKQFAKQNLASLPNSDQEIKTIETYFSGSKFINENATKENFLKALPKHKIIHLATHADAQDSISPWIAFRNNKLLLEELYLTNNKAKMVVLSGCNTQLGKQEIGEGVMSLARGFFNSGSESVVSTLWEVQDLSTSYIMNEFYKNLSNNQTKSKALRQAKLNYLEAHMFSEKSPSYWASFVLLGNTSPLLEEPKISMYWWLLLLPVMILLFSLYKKFKS